MPGLASGVYLYADNTACSPVSRFVVSLTMHVRKDVLCTAVNEVMSMFPNVAVRPAVEDGRYVFIPNSGPVPVFDGSLSRAGLHGEEDLHGYLFRVSFSGKTVYFDVHSSLLDERGLAAFAKSVIFRYIQLAGFPVENDGNVRALPDALASLSMDDPMAMLEDIPASRPAWYMDAKAYVTCQSGVSAPHDMIHVAQVKVPLARLRSHAREYIASPEIFVSPIVSHAVYEMNRENMKPGEYVVASISVSLRRYFPTLSFLPFFTTVSLAYNRRLHEYPFNTILMSQKKLLEAQLKTDALAYNVQRKIDDMERISRPESLEARKAAASEAALGKASKSTYMIRNAGNIGMPDSMDRYVTEFYPLYTPGLQEFTVSTIVFRNEMVLTLAGKSSAAGALCRRIASLMNENEIYAYMSDEFDFSPACLGNR